MAWSERALRATDVPKIPDAPQMAYVTRNQTPTSSLSHTPPTTLAMSAMEWQPAWELRKLPWTMAQYVFRNCQASTLMAPGSAPRTNIAEGMERTPVAKITIFIGGGRVSVESGGGSAYKHG